MEVKDTVMSDEEMGYVVLAVAIKDQWCFRGDTLEDNLPSYQAIAQAQAEISFKAGVREVVEWITPRLDKIGGLISNIRGDWTDPRKDCRTIWNILAEVEAKFKEWGIEEVKE